jgi:hypothetical protein
MSKLSQSNPVHHYKIIHENWHVKVIAVKSRTSLEDGNTDEGFCK